ncbi:DJ-1/PfpI family protein [Pyricularia oryzae 70-15]|uniref:DJ-1/PfpI family protein n=3 Tax=Pyricularia oryzae TaxID=318829 RepID=G4NIM6_PYRO7|nr:DJ-1/PfpI family protein [Pyricularia oryzae 70-15]EHA48086.1 DJ-1/PfpI family protein [Pyricularia oryzae 70-15]ELQ32517.1 DJ-1/PfpI family protein [Pyricularia oryzae Y34]KAI7913566.1 DJ-1/PfpI family protein [Pyricularia oryzae]
MSTQTPSKPFRMGVLLEGVQISDIMGIDLIGNLSRKYVSAAQGLNPGIARFLESAIDLEIFYLAETLAPTEVTPSFKYLPNVTYDDCPRDLDLVLIGGNGFESQSEASKKFIREAWPKTRVWMTTCVGTLWLASAVDLTGLKVTTNRVAIEFGKQLYPGAEWQDKRWVVEDKVYEGQGKGELWTGGAAGAGLDMVTEWCFQNFDKDFVNALSTYPLEFQPGRSFDQNYNYDLKDVGGPWQPAAPAS